MFRKLFLVLMVSISFAAAMQSQSKKLPISHIKSKKKIALRSSEATVELGNIEFNVFQANNREDFVVQFLNPVYQKLEMYLINLSGEKVQDVLIAQYINTGVKTFTFNLPEAHKTEMHFLVIKADEKTLLQKVEAIKKKD